MLRKLLTAWKRLSWWSAGICATVVIGAYAYLKLFPGAKPDNMIEEMAEEVIKDQLGIDVDLTPSTPEKK